MVPIQRFFAHSVTCEEQTPARFVPERECKHAVESVQRFIAPLLISVNDDFGITFGAENMAEFLKFKTEIREIVNLSIEDHHDGAVFIGDRLLPPFDIDNREPRYGKT